jgi:hypothetical protein
VALGRSGVVVGAALLFLTNIVAIVLGAACSLFAVGIRGSHDSGHLVIWGWRVSLAVVVVLVGLTVYESLPPAKLPNEIRSRIDSRLAEADADVVSIKVDRADETMQVGMVINTPSAPTKALAGDLLNILQAHFRREVQLELKSHLITRVRS